MLIDERYAYFVIKYLHVKYVLLQKNVAYITMSYDIQPPHSLKGLVNMYYKTSIQANKKHQFSEINKLFPTRKPLECCMVLGMGAIGVAQGI